MSDELCDTTRTNGVVRPHCVRTGLRHYLLAAVRSGWPVAAVLATAFVLGTSLTAPPSARPATPLPILHLATAPASAAVTTSTVATQVPIAPAPTVETPVAVLPIVATTPTTTLAPPVASRDASDYVLTGLHWKRGQSISVYSTIPEAWPVVAEVARITGLHLVPVASSSGAQITIGYGVPPCGDGCTQLRHPNGSSLIDHASIVLNPTHGNILGDLMHEMGHAVGLGHAHQRGEVMYPSEPLPTVFSPSDIAGLKAVGRL